MGDIITFLITVFTGFFAIMNPIGGIPVFLSLTEGATKEKKLSIARKSTLVAFLIGLSFILFGSYLFNFFGITIPAFKITGGAILFFTGFEMLQSKKTSVKNLRNINVDENIAVSPLAIPLLAGPGTIVTGMDFVSNSNLFFTFLVILVFSFICYLNFIAFKLSQVIIDKIGENIITVFGKIMGLIIAIIGTNMVIDGIKMAFDIS